MDLHSVRCTPDFEDRGFLLIPWNMGQLIARKDISQCIQRFVGSSPLESRDCIRDVNLNQLL
jgi:hypothetical protein